MNMWRGGLVVTDMAVDVRTVELDRAITDDPWEEYRRIAGGGPVQHVRFPGGEEAWLVIGYDEARILLDDPRLSKDIRTARVVLGLNGPEWQNPMVEHLLNAD